MGVIYCLNLMDKPSIMMVKNACEMMQKDFELIKVAMPVNKNIRNLKGTLYMKMLDFELRHIFRYVW